MKAVPDHFQVLLPNGSITYYPNGDYFVAECQHHIGGTSGKLKCKRTRTAQGSARGSGPQGRPLGFLAAYLQHCGGDEIRDPNGHYELAKTLTFEQRREARHWLRSAPGCDQIFAQERPQREGESSEPEDSVA